MFEPLTAGVVGAARVRRILESAPMQYVTEADLQREIAEALAGCGISVTREVRLSDGVSRIDLLAGSVGIEVKIDGRVANVRRQLARYALCSEISALLLVTNRAHHTALGDSLNGKPVLVASLIGAGL